MNRLRVTYHLDVAADEAEARADAVAVEQTVEVPRSALAERFFDQEVIGQVEAIEADPEGGFRATLAYPVETTALDPAQLLNVIFGNSSLQHDVRCLDIDVPQAVRVALEGPRFGIEGLRKVAGVERRPLTCTAIKPMGLDTAALARLCGSFARAGIDVVKDDHGLADQSWSRFEERVPACLDAAREAAETTGRHALYVPNRIGTPERVLRGLHFAQECGARAVMVSPMLIGLPFFWELVHRHASVPVLAHPAFAGVQRIAPEALFGRLLRLFGADAVIFVSFGSRFARSREACRELARRLLAPWGALPPSLPVPAGGIRIADAADLVRCYGRDSMLLVGGDLQIDPARVAERARAFADAVAEAGAALPISAD
jgi:ribulose-bisphosphate carboxylase large chain